MDRERTHREAPAWAPHPAFSRQVTSDGSPTGPGTPDRHPESLQPGRPQARGGAGRRDGSALPLGSHPADTRARTHADTHVRAPRTQDGPQEGQEAGRSAQRSRGRWGKGGLPGARGLGAMVGGEGRPFPGGDPSTSPTASVRVPGRGLARGEGVSGDRTGGGRQKRDRPACFPGASRVPMAGTCPLGASTAHGKPRPVAAALQVQAREQPHPGTCCKQSLRTHLDLHNQKLP